MNKQSSNEALEKLICGNGRFVTAKMNDGDISEGLRKRTCREGQTPYAVVVTCSDSRVIPEHIFMTGLGELFVIRVAGNVIGEHELGSIEYATEHLGCPLVLILGHTHCGAVNAAIGGGADGYTKIITEKIRAAIGNETDDYSASRMNVTEGVKKVIKSLPDINAAVIGAIYDIETGKTEFLN